MAPTPSNTPITSPYNLERWQQQLHQLVLPTDPTIKTVALQKLHARTANAGNIAAIISHDPALSLLLIHDANKSLALSGTETSSLAHTISLLGFPRVEAIIRRSPDYDNNRVPQLAEFRQQLSLSLHAAQQAKAWAALNPHWQQQAVFWPALFQRAPIWALWYQAGDTMAQLQHLQARHRGASHALIEQQVLGTTVQALCAALCRSWQLPKLTQLSWQPRASGSARHWVQLGKLLPEQAHIALEQQPRLRAIARNQATLIALANSLAETAEWDWFSTHTLRRQRMLATVLNQSLDSSISLSHQQALASTRLHPLAGTLSPARQLLSYYRKADSLSPLAVPAVVATAATASKPARNAPPDASAARPRPKPRIPAAAPPEAAPPSEPPLTLAAFMQRLRHQPAAFGNRRQLIQQTLDTLCQQLPVQRAWASLLKPGSQQLRINYSVGEPNPALQSFSHRLQRGDLFHKLLQRPLSLRLHPDNYPQIWPLLPDEFKRACGGDEFFMMSIFADKKPIAILYCDQGQHPEPLTEQHYQQFKQLCKTVSQCLPVLT